MDSTKILRIQQEIRWLSERNIRAEFIDEGVGYILYYDVEASAASGLPSSIDVLVPVPDGYPSQQIDMPALPANSPFIPKVVGGSNPQGTILIAKRHWTILSYHPYGNGGGPPWNPMKHGFHDYYNHIYIWLHRLQ